MKNISRPAAIIVSVFLSAQTALAGPGLLMPDFDAEWGRALFGSKGCAACHSVNGVGGQDAPTLDFDTAAGPMDPFDFVAKMWRGAEAMIYMQQDELGAQIELTGAELAAIVAFAHDPVQQQLFSMDDIPENIAKIINRTD